LHQFQIGMYQKSDLFDIVNEDISKQLHGEIAKLLYLATYMRTDILCSTILLMSRFQLLTVQGLNKFLDLLFSKKGTVSFGIMLNEDKDNRIRFGVHDSTSRSHCDALISYGRGTNFVLSNFLKQVCIFSSKAEHMQLTTTVSIAARERNFAIEQQTQTNRRARGKAFFNIQFVSRRKFRVALAP